MFLFQRGDNTTRFDPTDELVYLEQQVPAHCAKLAPCNSIVEEILFFRPSFKEARK